MPEQNTTPSKKAPGAADHDRVSGLSIRVDGTLDQTDPEIIGDVDAVIEATKRQFAERAVSNIDAAKRAELGLTTEAVEAEPDKPTAALQKEQEAAVATAEKQAEAIVKALS